jgi:hypothetical protein
MIEPVAFARNPDSARTNAFMRDASGRMPDELQSSALREFRALVGRLESEGVEALIFRDSVDSPSPDAIFPNNWVSFHENGQVILYPMEPPNRRRERRREILDWLSTEMGFRVSEVVDLSFHETEGRFLEGTGSMVFDRPGKTVYASASPRTTPSLLREYGERFGLEVVSFRAYDAEGIPVYHTNVVLALGPGVAVLCSEAIRDPSERRGVVKSLESGGREVVEITMEQLYAFAGNMLAVENSRRETLLVMSERAFSSLRKAELQKLGRHARLVQSPIPTIEDFGGGSVRCMLAEVFLPRHGARGI